MPVQLFRTARQRPACHAACRRHAVRPRSAHAVLAHEVVKLGTVAVEHVDVYLGRDAPHAPVWAQLPVHEVYVGLVLAVACYPHVVVLLEVWGQRQVLVDERLADVQHGTRAHAPLHGLHPRPHRAEEGRRAAHALHLAGRRLHIEYGWHVALSEVGVAQEERRLYAARRRGGEEVVRAARYALPTRGGIVGGIVAVAERAALSRLYVAERHGIVHSAAHALAAQGAKV